MSDVDKMLADAGDAYRKGNLAQADVLCRVLLNTGIESAEAYTLLSNIAASLRLPEFALEYSARALVLDPSSAPAAAAREAAGQLLATAAAGNSPGAQDNALPDRHFLFIKAWGFGFWSDVDHVIGQLLVAELTGRTPVVHWGLNSMFIDPDSRNAFIDYFEPVSGYKVKQVRKPEFSYYPPKWNHNNLLSPDNQKWSGEYARFSGINFLNRPENVVVSDFHTYLSDLVPWIPVTHPYFGTDPESLYRHLFRKHIRLKPHLRMAVDAFRQQHFSGKKVLAVHVRGSDKIKECTNLAMIHESYYPAIERHLDSGRATHLFLLTDSVPVLDSYRQRFGSRLITTTCTRSSDDTGVHHHPTHERSRLAREIILDTYLAAECDHFLGIGDSNVSTTVLHLKDWAPGHASFIGPIHCYAPHTALYDG